jgi:hypothetical protein
MRRWLLLAPVLYLLAWLARSMIQRWQRTLRGRPLSGRLAEYHGNGRLKSERHVLDGTMHGPWIVWDEQGNKVAEGAYDHGIVHGLEIDYDGNGVKIRETPWTQGRRHGTARAYDPKNGQVAREMCYVAAETDQPAHDGPCTDAELDAQPPDES